VILSNESLIDSSIGWLFNYFII